MSTLRRLKAYFGMVPAEELDDYATDDYAGDDYRGDYEPAYRAGRERVASARPSRWTDPDDHDDRPLAREPIKSQDYRDEPAELPPTRPAPQRRSWAAEPPVRGALAVDPAVEAITRASAKPLDDPSSDAHPLSRITTLHPRSYNEARSIGEHYRDGVPVIMNLTEMEDADAKRLVDFAAGLAFALRGSIDKVTTKVFLISPANVDVTAEERRRIAEGSFYAQH
jgi:cell division inhibitor SepF